MKISLLNKKWFNRSVILVSSLLSICGFLSAQTSTWDGSAWSSVEPSGSTGSYTFNVDGPDCTVGDANMATLNIDPNGVCTITGTVNATNVNLPLDAVSYLDVEGSLNVINLNNVSYLTGGGTINLSAGTYSQTDGTNYGSCDINNFNVLSGSITFPTNISFQNLLVAQGANVDLTYTGNTSEPTISGTLTLNGSFNNSFKASTTVDRLTTYYYFRIGNLLINSSGSFNSNVGYSYINQFLKIGGTIAPAQSINSYYYKFDLSGNTNKIDIFGSANVKFSDIAFNSAASKYLGTLRVYGGGKFIIDESFTVNTLTINADGNVYSIGNPILTATTIDPIAGRLILPGATLNYTPTILTLNGTNSALAYLNKPNYKVILAGATDTVRNCTFQQVIVNSGAKGYVTNNSSDYKIQRIDASDLVTIASLPKVDTIQISATGNVVLTGSTRVNRLVDIATRGSLTSNGNLTMRDESSLYFTTDGQIIGDIKWHRKYGTNGWIYMGVPFPNLTRGLFSTTGGISQQTISMNKYVESKVSPRWTSVGTSETLGVGTGYIVAMVTFTNDTLIFKGQPHLADVTVSGLTYSSSNGAQFNYQKGYNLVANPFTAPISVSGFFADNPLSAIYYWDNQGGNNGVYVTRTSGNLFTPDISSLTSKNQAKISTSYLAPNQGFFIKIDSTNSAVSSVIFKHSHITRDLNNNFLKSDPVYLRLFTKNLSGAQNDIIFQFNDTVSNNIINPVMDYSKLISDNYPLEIYSFKKSNKFAIQTLKLDTSVLVSIGLIVKKNEKYSLWVSNFDALPAGVDVYIHDKVANRIVNLKDSAFSVTLAAGTYDGRFEVVFKNSLSIGKAQPIIRHEGDNRTGQSIVVRAQNRQVFIDFPQEQRNVTIQVCDINGRVLYEKSLSSAQGSIMLDSNFYLNKVYFIRISSYNLFKISKLLMQ